MQKHAADGTRLFAGMNKAWKRGAILPPRRVNVNIGDLRAAHCPMHVVHRTPSAKADRNAVALNKQDVLPTQGAEHIPSQFVDGTAGMIRLRFV